MLAITTLQDFLKQLASKQPTPGGGASAAIAAATGLATAVMAVAYTTGKKYAAVAEEATTLHAEISQALGELLQLADDDGIAYAALQETWRSNDLGEEEVHRRQVHARAIPHRICMICIGHGQMLLDFGPHTNPNLKSDLLGGMAILSGALQAAWQTYLINQPAPVEKEKLAPIVAQFQNTVTKLIASANG